MTLSTVTFPVICAVLISQPTFGLDKAPMRKLTTGHILEGYQARTPSGHFANVFLGVPFAEPPVGQLRFRKTEPLRTLPFNSSTLISCRSYRASCWQNHSIVGDARIVSMSEDCLYLNIFSGLDCNENSVKLCPILYYIHGGAFEFDSPTMFSVDVLIDNFASKDIVLITVPYRLGALGFWSSGGPEAPGNNGINDVLEGLKWVQREIKMFGGDPSQVTIMGQSSGAAAVSLLTLTPRSEGLFQRAILMSKPRLVSDSQTPFQILAVELGCATEHDWAEIDQKSQVITDCMRKVDAEVLVDTYWKIETVMGANGRRQHLTGPRVDGPDGLFPDPFPTLVKNRRPINVIVGTTANENSFEKLVYENATAENISSLCESEITGLNLRHQNLLRRECERRYVIVPLRNYRATQSRDPSNFSLWAEQAAKFKNDFFYFSTAFDEASSLVRAGARVFLYSFDYVKRGLDGLAPWHAFDLTYILGVHPFQFDERDYQIRAIYASAFANFAKYGDPATNSSFSWTPLQDPPFGMNYLSVDCPKPSMRPKYHYDAILFWNYVVPTLGQRGVENISGHDVIRFYQKTLPPSLPSTQQLDTTRKLGVPNIESNWVKMQLERERGGHTISVLAAVTLTTGFVLMMAACTQNRFRRLRPLWRRRAKEDDLLLSRIESGYQTF